MNNDAIKNAVDKLNIKKEKYIKKYNNEVAELREQCQHKFKVLKAYRDNDGRSGEEIIYYKHHECDFCGLNEIVETSRSKY